MEYEDIRTTAGKLLQYVRSMPAVTSAIVGHKVNRREGWVGGTVGYRLAGWLAGCGALQLVSGLSLLVVVHSKHCMCSYHTGWFAWRIGKL